MSDGVHLLVPFAGAQAPGHGEASRGLALPHLEKLLGTMVLADRVEGGEHSLSMPHERVLARAFGLEAADGRTPWAAWSLAQGGGVPGAQAWAWITPCHWRVGRDHIAMEAPEALALEEAESRTLLAAMLPFFEEDGIGLAYEGPTRWLAHGEIFRSLATASLDRVVGRVIDEWIPRVEEARTVRRLQQEMQMLLYTHPVNEARAARGLLPVNSFWVSGAGALAGAAASAAVEVATDLRAPALQGDWAAWAQAFQALDAREGPRLAEAATHGVPVRITLSGERHAQTWATGSQGLWSRLKNTWRRRPASAWLENL